MPYAPRPTGCIGGTYLAETSKRFPRTLYCTYRPPCVGTPLASLSTASISISLALRSIPSEEKIKAFSQTSSVFSLFLSHTHTRELRRRKKERGCGRRGRNCFRVGTQRRGPFGKLNALCLKFEYGIA